MSCADRGSSGLDSPLRCHDTRPTAFSVGLPARGMRSHQIAPLRNKNRLTDTILPTARRQPSTAAAKPLPPTTRPLTARRKPSTASAKPLPPNLCRQPPAR